MRKFLFAVVIGIVLVAAVLFALRLYAEELSEVALVPTEEFVAPEPVPALTYQDAGMWFYRPGTVYEVDPVRWQPADVAEGNLPVDPPAPITAAPPPRYAVFFVHPTSYLERSSWNAPLDHPESQARARLMVRGMASPFSGATEIWVPRYRQATFGAFLTDAPEAQQAIDAAYADIEAAFAVFVASSDQSLPIVLAGHSQGARHINRLLSEPVKGTPLAARVAMAYPIGWPISVEHDLPALGLPACTAPEQTGCIASWASFAEPADPGQFLKRYAAIPGNDGQPRGESPILCVNPLTGVVGDTAPMSRNLGTLVPDAELTSGELLAGAVPARCDPASGLLLIGDPPDLGRYVLPGNNYHVYDIPLFWRNLQTDVTRRMSAWTASRP